MRRALGLLAVCLAGCGDPGPGAAEDLLGDASALPSDGGDGAVAADLAPPPPDLAKPGVPYVYVSGNTTSISRFSLDPMTGVLTPAGTTPISGNPSFLAVDPAQKRLFAAKESGNLVAAFTIDQATGALTGLGADVSSGGNGPAHLSVDKSGAWVLVANYGDGAVRVIPITATGLGMPSDTRNAGANAHQILTDATNAFAFVPCKGASYTAQYTFNVQTGVLAANPVATVGTPSGAGPRHLAFHPNGLYAYVIMELSSRMHAYTVDTAAGRLTDVQDLSTLPAPMGGNTGAEVVVHPSGRFLYGSNRGHDSIVIYALSTTGRMTLVGHQPTGGQTPRSFTVDPTGKWLLVANQGSNEVRIFAIDPTAGTLTPAASPVAATNPAFVGLVTLP